MKKLIILFAIICMISCTAKVTMPKGASDIEEIGNNWYYFTLDGNRYLYRYHWGFYRTEITVTQVEGDENENIKY